MKLIHYVLISLYALAGYGIGVKVGQSHINEKRAADSIKLQNCIKQVAEIK